MVGKRCNEENYLPTSRFQLLIFVTRQEQTLERTTTKEIKAITLGGGGRVWRFERGRGPKPKMKERSIMSNGEQNIKYKPNNMEFE